MARIKRAQIRKTRVRKLFKRAKGFFLSRGNTLRQAHEAVLKARRFEFEGRKQRKRHFRALWITRISAAAKANGTSYSRLMNGLNKAGVQINRKMLSEIAIHDAAGFTALVERAQQALTSASSSQ